jgi:hypothetical protein
MFRSSRITGTGGNQFPVTGLLPGHAYIMYLVAEDVRSNLQFTVSSMTFTTLGTGQVDTTPPTVSLLLLDNITQTGARLTL